MENIYAHLTGKLSPSYTKVLKVNAMIEFIIELVVVGILLGVSYYFHWFNWINIVLYVIGALIILDNLWDFFFQSKFTVNNWAYEVDEQYIQLKRGRLFEHYEMIPMTKVQFVATNQGPILRKYGLYTLRIGTMGSEHAIPGLPEDEALRLREEIARYAKVKEVEV